MKVIWIAGAIRADNGWEREQNIRRAEALALKVWQAGMAAICVHSFCRPYALGNKEENLFLPGDLEIMKRCNAVLVVTRWGKSIGTKGEIEEADKMDIPVFYSIGRLKEWVKRVGQL